MIQVDCNETNMAMGNVSFSNRKYIDSFTTGFFQPAMLVYQRVYMFVTTSDTVCVFFRARGFRK